MFEAARVEHKLHYERVTLLSDRFVLRWMDDCLDALIDESDVEHLPAPKRRHASVNLSAVLLPVMFAWLLTLQQEAPRVYETTRAYGLEIIAKKPSWASEVVHPHPVRVANATSIVLDELSRYPDGFVANQCGLKRIYLVSGTGSTSIPGLRSVGTYSPRHDSFWISIDPDRDGAENSLDLEYLMRITTVHEIDHACNMTLRASEDIEAWSALVTLPEGLTQSDIETYIVDGGPPPPKGFARWYAASTALTDDVRIKHVEDEASIKELITYDWPRLRRDEALLEKAEELIRRYESWTDGALNREYFENWHVSFSTLGEARDQEFPSGGVMNADSSSWSLPRFSYWNHESFSTTLDETHSEERESLYEYADER